jgi:hypothetical protein
MDEKIKNTYLSTGFAFPGITYKEIDNVTKDNSVEEDITKFTFSQNLYLLQLQRKGGIQFPKPATVNIKVFNNEWILPFLIIINKMIVDLQEVRM